VSAARQAAGVAVLFGLHGAARQVDAAIGLLLHSSLDLPDFVGRALGLVRPAELGARAAMFAATGLLAWLVLGLVRSRRASGPLGSALGEEARGFAPLLLRPAITLSALAALALRPTYPYGLTFPVALTQDWGLAQDAAALAALVAWRAPQLRLPAPGAASMFLMAFVGYGLLTPERVRHWDGHPGNEPKYLRMGAALGWGLSLDVEPWTSLAEDASPLEGVAPAPLVPSLVRAAGTLGRESLRLLVAALPGEGGLGRTAIRAERVDRQTVSGKEGGVYHVLAPGPSLLLAAPLRLDRALDRLRGTPGRIGVSVLAWNALAAATLVALFLLLRDATDRPGLAALLAGLLGALPPFLFYGFQFYPELPAALVMAEALRRLLLRPRPGPGDAWVAGLLLAALPWLHQKFLPAWGVLLVVGVGRQVWQLVPRGELLRLLAPQALSAYLTLLWNYAISGSARPDALFLAWGPAGVTSERIHEGLLGLLLDARYGLLPYVPVYLLGIALAALPKGDAGGRRLLAWGTLPVLAYYLTVAAADNWSGAVSNLGRYVMPALPLLGAALAMGLSALRCRRGVLALALTLVAWSALLAVQLWRDPHAANDSARLLASASIADGNVYVPNLFFRSPEYGSPGGWARVLAWGALAGALGLWLRRVFRGRGGDSPDLALAGTAVALLATALVLERWPSPYRAPRFGDGLALADGATAFVSGATLEDGVWRARGQSLALLVRSPQERPYLALTVAGEGTLHAAGLPPVRLRPSGSRIDVPLEPVARLVGRRGAREVLARQRVEIESRGEVTLRVPFADNQGTDHAGGTF
jgi:hypothetical protein